MRRLRGTVMKNAAANIVRGGASAIVALVLPHFLTRALDPDRFAAWSLMLQVAAYASYLDFGLQTAVARYFARAAELGDDEGRDRLVSTALALLAGAGLAALLGIGVVIVFLPRIFHQAPPFLIGELREGVAVLAVSAAVLLPASTFTGVLVGMHRNEYPALAIGGTRLLGAVAVIVGARHTTSLAALAACVAVCNVGGGLAQYAAVRRLLPIRLGWARVSRAMAMELVGYCSTLTVWSAGMFLVSGLDLTLVGYFDFRQVSYYAVALTLVLFLAGINSSVVSALLAPFATMHARHEGEQIERVVLSTTRLSSLANVAFVVVVFLWGRPLVSLWVGPSYADASLLFLRLLAVGQAVRLLGSAFSMAVVATGLQRYSLPSVLGEGITNLGASVWLARRMGAAGVAWGTVIGACAGVAIMIMFVMRPREDLNVHRGRFLWQGVGVPVLAFSPLLAWIWFRG